MPKQQFPFRYPSELTGAPGTLPRDTKSQRGTRNGRSLGRRRSVEMASTGASVRSRARVGPAASIERKPALTDERCLVLLFLRRYVEWRQRGQGNSRRLRAPRAWRNRWLAAPLRKYNPNTDRGSARASRPYDRVRVRLPRRPRARANSGRARSRRDAHNVPALSPGIEQPHLTNAGLSNWLPATRLSHNAWVARAHGVIVLAILPSRSRAGPALPARRTCAKEAECGLLPNSPRPR